MLGPFWDVFTLNPAEPVRAQDGATDVGTATDLMEARTLPSTRSFFSLPTLITAIFKMKKLCVVPPALLPEVLCASAKKMLPLHSSASYRWCRET